MGYTGVGCPEEQGVQWGSCAQGLCWMAEGCTGTVCAKMCRCQLAVHAGAVHAGAVCVSWGGSGAVCRLLGGQSVHAGAHGALWGTRGSVGHTLPQAAVSTPAQKPSRLCQEHTACVPPHARGHTRAPVPAQTPRTIHASPSTTPKPKPQPQPHFNPKPNLKPNPAVTSACVGGAEPTHPLWNKP